MVNTFVLGRKNYETVILIKGLLSRLIKTLIFVDFLNVLIKIV